MKQMSKEKLKARRSRTAFEEVEEDLRLSLHLHDPDSTKDAVADQQLDFKQLLARYKGNVLPGGNITIMPKITSFSHAMIQKKKNVALVS